MTNNKRYQIVIGSPIEYNELVAYIIVDGQHIALLNQERGCESLSIEFFREPKITTVDFDIFLQALQEAKKKLLLT